VTRLWEFQFDDRTGRLTNAGNAITPADFSISGFDLSSDGRTLMYSGSPTGSRQGQIWELALDSQQRRLRIADSRGRVVGRFVGANLVYTRKDDSGFQLAYIKPNDSAEYVVAESKTLVSAFDSSVDGQTILGTALVDGSFAIVSWPFSAAPHAERSVRPLFRDAGFSVWNSRYSPDGKWLCFNANGPPVSIVGVTPSSGDLARQWVRVSNEKDWSDRPRWSSDGSILFYVAGFRGISPNVWGMRFDKTLGRPHGSPIQVTTFDSPAKGLPQNIDLANLSIGKGRLIVPVVEVSGSIWMLDGVDKRPVR
jgi:Tol biopolymer transport system component